MNEDVYIIGGGPSLKDFDFEQLRDLDTIAVNVAALDVPDPTYCITSDSGQFRKLCEGYYNDVNTTWVVITNPNHATMKYDGGKFKHITSNYVYNLFAPNILIRNAGIEGIGFSFNDFRTGYNSGFCALQLAVLLRYKKIHLLGIDLVTGKHYHDKYNGLKISRSALEEYYKNFILALNILKEKTDIEVISHSKSSRLNKVISYTTFKPPFKRPSKASQPLPKGLTPKTLSNRLKIRVFSSSTAYGRSKLSVLICSLYNRKESLDKLLKILQEQKTDEVEILVGIDGGEISTGEKRNKLLKKSIGKYIVFVDDDDLVSIDYIKKILIAIKSNPDCCGIEGQLTNKKGKYTFFHSIKYKSWFTSRGIYYRSPNHISPVKRSLALQTKFKLITVGEDKDYSVRLLPLLKTEVEIPGILYYYITR